MRMNVGSVVGRRPLTPAEPASSDVVTGRERVGEQALVDARARHHANVFEHRCPQAAKRESRHPFCRRRGVVGEGRERSERQLVNKDPVEQL